MNLRFHLMENIVAGWVNRHQQAVIEYLKEERQILIEQLGGKPKAHQETRPKYSRFANYLPIYLHLGASMCIYLLRAKFLKY